MYNGIVKNDNIIRDVNATKIVLNYNDGGFLEITSPNKNKYGVEFKNKDGLVDFYTEIESNMWCRTHKKYFVEYRCKVWDIVTKNIILDDLYNPFGKRVYISFESSSIGDTLAWIPYVEEFSRKWDCKVICSTFHNNLFENQYKNVDFVAPGTIVNNIYATYRIGLFFNDGQIDYSKHKFNPTSIPLQKICCDILGLDFIELKPKLDLPMKTRGKKVGIGFHSTAQTKYWNNPTGWQDVTDFLVKSGYEVIILSKEEDGYMGNYYPKGVSILTPGSIESVVSELMGCEFFIGISSGLSWLSWATNTPTLLLSGFTDENLEPNNGIFRIINKSVCNGCWSRHKFDPGDWNWCPEHKATDRQFECSKLITSDMVIDVLVKNKLIIEDGIDYDFIEIGTSDFDTLIENVSGYTRGLSIEPIKYYIDRLPNKPGVNKINAAISSNDGFMQIYYIDDKKIIENKLPWWVRGSNSINKPHPFVIKEIGKELYDKLVTIDNIPTIKWSTLISDYNIKSIDYLKIDTEGHDHIILNGYLDECFKNKNLLANKILFECHSEVSDKNEIDKVLKRFELFNYKVEYLESDIILTKNKIPRIIHQTYKNFDLPKSLSDNIKYIKELNPTFEYRFYDDDDCISFIRENYDSETLELYLSINNKYGQARADFFRYLLMYKVGGVYLDIKSGMDRPLDDIILPNDEYILTHWDRNDWADEIGYALGEFQNWHIICVPNHPFLEKVIDEVKNNIRNYISGVGKESVLRLTGPIAYSIGIVKVLDIYRKMTFDSPVRELRTCEEIGLVYLNINEHHHQIYGGYSEERLIIKNDKKAYVLYSNDIYYEVTKKCVESIRLFSGLPIYIYMVNSDNVIDIENVFTIRWDIDSDLGANSWNGSHINRKDNNIYRLLIQRPLIVKDVLEKYADIVVYIDSDSVVTQKIETIFSFNDYNLSYPLFTEGIYDYLMVGGLGGVEDDYSTSLEHSACVLFGVDQSIRRKYRQTGYFIANKNNIDFLEEWYWMCSHPSILKQNAFYAPFNEETILNVLLWKKKIFNGLPYIYINSDLSMVKEIFNGDFNRYGDDIKEWIKVPEKNNLLFLHGNKDIEVIDHIIDIVKKATY